MKIYITKAAFDVQKEFFTQRALNELSKYGEVSMNPYKAELTQEQLAEIVRDVDILVTGWGTCKLDETVLKNADNLKLIAHTGGSVAGLVDEYVYNRGIRVIGGNETFAKSVAEGCLCYVLAMLRRVNQYSNLIHYGGWKPIGERQLNRGLFGKKVGLIGFGAIAKHFARMLKLFETEIYVYSRHLSKDEADLYGVKLCASQEELFETCDIVSVHSALTPETVGSVSAELLAKMKDGAILLNTARGAIVDEEALIKELKTGRIFAALDTFEVEPLPYDSPLRTLPNVLAMPHMGGPTVDMREMVTLDLASDIGRFLRNEELKFEIPKEHVARMTQDSLVVKIRTEK